MLRSSPAVLEAIRDGGQKQFIERPMPAMRDESLAPVLAWALARLDRPITVTRLAALAFVGPATNLRALIGRATGLAPSAYRSRFGTDTAFASTEHAARSPSS